MNAPDLSTPSRVLRFCGFLLAAIALAAPLAFGGVNRWTTSGPFGVAVTSLAIDPVNPETVYAGTTMEGMPFRIGVNAVFKSRDGGLSWTASLLDPSGSAFPSGLAIDPLFSSVVYAATNRGVFKSVDAGGSWAAVGGPVSDAPAYSVAVDPVTPSTILAGTAGGLFKSNDRGASWSGRLLASSIYNLVFSPQTPSTIFGTEYETSSSYYYGYYASNSFLYKSTDAGATWSKHSTGSVIVPGALAIDPTNSSTLYAGNSYGGGVYKSVDSGSTWLKTSTDLNSKVISVVIDPRNPSTLYAANHGAIFRSKDSGATWRRFDAGLTGYGVTALAIDRTGTRLHAGTFFGAGVFDYQIFAGALDLSVGTDNKAHLLLADLDNRVVFRSFDSSGNSTSSGPHGPFSGWYATAVADGSDGLTRVLWNHLDGSAALWLLGATSNLASYRYSPGAGWTAVDVSVDPNNTTQVLWANTDGRTSLWSLDISGAVVSTATLGPYQGWLARAISSGPDGLTRLLWSNSDGRIGLSLIDAGEITATYRFEPPAGWTAQDLTVAADNKTRILLSIGEGLAALWAVSNSGVLTNSQATYEPPAAAQTATRISAGADGLTRLLWTGPEGTGTLWLLDLSNVFQASFRVGATP